MIKTQAGQITSLLELCYGVVERIDSDCQYLFDNIKIQAVNINHY